MEIKELAEKYKLTKSDAWQHKQSGNWIISHDAVEKIAAMEKITMVDFKILNSEQKFARFLITMKKEEKTISSIGEAASDNCTNKYIGCMAEKRGIDRCVLKLIDAYQYGIYSDQESEDFKKGANK